MDWTSVFFYKYVPPSTMRGVLSGSGIFLVLCTAPAEFWDVWRKTL